MPRTPHHHTEPRACSQRTAQARVLQLDIQGTPQAWISPEQAEVHYVSGTVAWTAGDQPYLDYNEALNGRSWPLPSGDSCE